MSESKPVIILAFSNDQDDYLKMIVRERKAIFKALQEHDDNGYIQVHKEENTSIEDIFDLFNRYAGNIAIFHYGGHANGSHLQLEAGVEKAELADAGGLAQLMGLQKSLKLVFLNGCATLDQVELLFSCGVKTVIATSVPINDEMATEFAEQFYQALANKVSIRKAFETAKAFVATRYGSSKNVGEYRDLLLNDKGESPPTDMPWGLYINEKAGEALDWKLPDVKREVNIGIAVSGQKTAPVNQALIEMLTNALPQYSRAMARFLEDLESGEKDERELPLAIMDSFPLPIGKQLEKLFSSDLSAIHEQRLQQLVLTYEIIAELLCFTMLSQLWEDRHRNPKLNIKAENQKILQRFLELQKDLYPMFNYIELIAAVSNIYKENKLDPFVDEFKNLNELLQQEAFQQAHQFLDEMRVKLSNEKIAADEIENLCIQSEKCLGTIMAGFAFIAKYKLTTIKEIKIIKHRHAEPRYSHSYFLLDRTTGQKNLMDTQKEFGSFTECQSVILLKSVKDLDQYLSLSPFVIDENALTGDRNSKLFFYSFQEAAEQSYHFQFIDNRNDSLVISENQYPLLKEQLETFHREILAS